jgi:hypothetical protein
MKRTVAVVAILALALVGSAFAKKHYEPPVYDHTGKFTITASVHSYDTESHLTVEGTTIDAYCDFTQTSVTCRDSNVFVNRQSVFDSPVPRYSGSSLVTSSMPFVGNEMLVAFTLPAGLDCFDFAGVGGFQTCDPLYTLAKRVWRDLGTFTKDKHELVATHPFQYRLVTGTGNGHSMARMNYFCVPFTGVTKKGKEQSGETCYMIQ